MIILDSDAIGFGASFIAKPIFKKSWDESGSGLSPGKTSLRAPHSQRLCSIISGFSPSIPFVISVTTLSTERVLSSPLDTIFFIKACVSD